VHQGVSPESHRKTRLARAEELAEDYVEVIDDLIAAYGEARVVAIAERFGVTHVTVTRTVARLQKQGLVRSQRYRSIFLSESGKKLAERVRRRHALVVSFLEALGVDANTARVDAEGIEHYVSEGTLRAFKRFCEMKLSTKQKVHLGLVRRGVVNTVTRRAVFLRKGRLCKKS
jgi:DtxR family manganese transport transcriptional regulator